VIPYIGMADVQFTEEQEFTRANVRPSLFTRLAFATGLVETEQGAQYLLLCVAVAFVSVTIYMVSAAFTKTTKYENPYKAGHNALLPASAAAQQP
jgi:hypothetical protein